MLKPDEKHFLGNINQKAVIRKSGKILMIQYSDDPKIHPNVKARGKWDMPGGRLNVGEDVLVGLKREVQEEVGVDISVEKILCTGIFRSLSGSSNFFVIYEACLVNDSDELVLRDGEAVRAEWFDPKEVVDLPIIYPEYKEALKQILL